MTYPENPGFKGAPAGTGAQAAPNYIPQVKGRRAQVLKGLEPGAATAEELGERIGLHWYLTRPRLSELKALGLVTETGARGRGALGGEVNVWRLTSPEERAKFTALQAMAGEKGEDQ